MVPRKRFCKIKNCKNATGTICREFQFFRWVFLFVFFLYFEILRNRENPLYNALFTMKVRISSCVLISAHVWPFSCFHTEKTERHSHVWMSNFSVIQWDRYEAAWNRSYVEFSKRTFVCISFHCCSYVSICFIVFHMWKSIYFRRMQKWFICVQQRTTTYRNWQLRELMCEFRWICQTVFVSCVEIINTALPSVSFRLFKLIQADPTQSNQIQMSSGSLLSCFQ